MKRIATFLLSLLIAAILADFGLGLMLDRLYRNNLTGDSGGRLNHYLLHGEGFESVIVGSSRALLQVDPALLPVKTYNLGHRGRYLNFQAALVSILAQESKLPPLLLLHLEPSEFMKLKQPNPADRFTIIQLGYYYGKNAEVTRYIDDQSPWEQVKFFSSLYRYNGKIVPLLASALPVGKRVPAFNGRELLPPTPGDSARTIYSSEKQKNADRYLSATEPLWEQYLLDLLEICKKEGVQVICFTTPAFFDFAPQTEPAFALLEKITRERSIPWLRYSINDLPELAEPKLWRDALHLNQTGAALFSSVFANDLMQLLEGQTENRFEDEAESE